MPVEAATKAAAFASVLPSIDKMDLAEVMVSEDSVLAVAVQAARDMGRLATLRIVGFQNT
ncbi:hypothetical protein ACQEVC_43075 [Plantactinospora sp. CA-294935]|uniref:hypothetical protein n=1 Tax=Plantactinospora sp. CA-294935 TaxID=3240012 RepID=UPI003D8BDB93